jgi:micrococcal nuclease
MHQISSELLMNKTFDFAIVNVVKVVDGDTLDLMLDLGFYQYGVYRIRLLDIDTPELRGINAEPEKALAAKQFVEQWIVGKTLRVETYKTEVYGRWLGKIYEVGTDATLNTAILEAGLGVPY